MASFSSPAVKKAIKVAQDMGLPVSGFELLSDGTIRILTGQDSRDPADAALEQWMKSQHGKG